MQNQQRWSRRRWWPALSGGGSRRCGEKGWTRVELAGKLGISRERLAKWELGDNSPPLGMLIRLKRVLAVTLDELVTGEPSAGGAMTERDRQALADCLERLARFLEVP